MSHTNLTSWPSLVRTIVLTAGFSALAVAQPAPGPKFQYASLTGAGNTIVVSRAPVVTASGQTIYQDITLQFDTDADGNLTVTTGSPTVTPSPSLLISSFQAGKYTGPRTVASGKASISVSGPGVAPGGSNVWSSNTNGDSDSCTYPASATWYVGPIENNSLLSRMQKIGITSTAWTYGVMGSGIASSCGSQFFNWGNGAIVGVSQVGNTITFASFTRNSFDSASPVDQITYTLVP